MHGKRKGRRQPRVGIALAIGLAALASSARSDEPAWPRRARPERRTTSRAQDPEVRVVRLNYVSATWDQVLEHLAQATNSTLVLHDVPPGRYSRRDFRQYSRSDAVQILNQELEPLGYRILEKDRYLTVIEIQRARVEYPRAVFGAGREPTAEPPVPRSAAPPEFDPNRLTPPATASRPRAVDSPFVPRPARQPIQPVGHEQPEPLQTADSAATEEIELVSVTTRRPAVEVAQQLYAAFDDRVELLDTEPTELPAFRVHRKPLAERPRGGDTPWFILEMDSASNELHVHAPSRIAESVAALIRKLDAAPPRAGETVRLVPDAEQAAAVARDLHQQLAELRRGVPRGTAAAANPFVVAQADSQPPAGRAAQPPTAAEPAEPGTPADVLGNLRGDVSVEALQDLDLLILRGNERDIEAVMEVIRLIEQMAVGATPGIELFFLQNVDSEALAALLNDVFTRLTTLSTGTAASARQTRAVNVVAVGKPNAILVLAPQSMLDYVLELAEQLDQPVAPGTEVEVFFLRDAVATQVQTLLEQFYQQRPGLGTQIRVIADARTNSIIVNASPTELAEVTRLVRQIDRQQGRATAQVRVVPLKNALAGELAEFLNSVIQGVLNPAQVGVGQQVGAIAAAGNQALRDSRSVVLEFLTTDGAAQRIIRSGILSDIRITGDVRTNSLTIAAPEASMRLLLELVAVLDQPPSAYADIKVFPLQRADATAAAQLLQTLFPEGQEGQPGVLLAGAEGFGSALVPLRVSVDPRTNSIVAVGSPDVLGMVEALLFKIDAAEARNRRTEVLRLRNSPATDVGNAINIFLQSQRELLQIDPTRISTSEILEQEIIVTPEPISNSLIISATPQYFEQIVALARELDREPPQVAIQTLIVEVILEDTDEFGIELGFQDSILFNRSVIDPASLVTINETTTLPNGTQTTTQRIISQTGVPGFLFNNQPLGNNVGVNSSQVGTQGLTNFALGRINDDLGFGGLVLSASSQSINILLRALAAHRHVRILSRPQVTALDNQLAQIQVGQRVPIVDGVTISATGLANPNIVYDEAGIILTVTPRISPEGQVVMEVIAEKSQYTGAGVPIFTDATTGNVISSPIKDVTTAITSAKVTDGQTIVLGGMITKTEDVIESKVPYLGDIPLLGNLFRYDSRQHRRTELIIFLTPRIIRSDADVELIKQVEMERLHFFEDEAEMIHGPLMGVPSAALGPLRDPVAPFLPHEAPFGESEPMIMEPEPLPPRESTPVGPRGTVPSGPRLRQLRSSQGPPETMQIP